MFLYNLVLILKFSKVQGTVVKSLLLVMHGLRSINQPFCFASGHRIKSRQQILETSIDIHKILMVPGSVDGATPHNTSFILFFENNISFSGELENVYIVKYQLAPRNLVDEFKHYILFTDYMITVIGVL